VNLLKVMPAGLYGFCRIESLNSIISIASPQALATKEVGYSSQKSSGFIANMEMAIGTFISAL